MLGIGRKKGVIGMHHPGPRFVPPLYRRPTDGKRRLGMDDVVLGILELLDQLFVFPRLAKPVLGVEKEVPGWETEDLHVVAFVDMIWEGGRVNINFMAQLREFFAENLGGG